MPVTSKSGIFYDMLTQRLNNRTLMLALAGVALVALAAVACNGDDSRQPDASPNASATPSGSPSPDASPGATVAPVVTPGSGPTPVQAVATYIDDDGLDGHRLDLTKQAECPLEAVIETPTVTSRISLGQFCLTAMNVVPEKAMTIVLDLPETGDTWEMKLEFDADVSLWKVKDVDPVSG